MNPCALLIGLFAALCGAGVVLTVILPQKRTPQALALVGTLASLALIGASSWILMTGNAFALRLWAVPSFGTLLLADGPSLGPFQSDYRLGVPARLGLLRGILASLPGPVQPAGLCRHVPCALCVDRADSDRRRCLAVAAGLGSHVDPHLFAGELRTRRAGPYPGGIRHAGLQRGGNPGGGAGTARIGDSGGIAGFCVLEGCCAGPGARCKMGSVSADVFWIRRQSGPCAGELLAAAGLCRCAVVFSARAGRGAC